MYPITAKYIIDLMTQGVTDPDALEDMAEAISLIEGEENIEERDLNSVSAGDFVFIPSMSDYVSKSVEFLVIAGFEEVLSVDIGLNDGACVGSVFRAIDGFVGERFIVLQVASYEDIRIVFIK